MRSFETLVLAIAVAGVAACGGREPVATPVTPETPRDLVLALFALSLTEDPTAEQVDALLGTLDDERECATRLDAIVELRAAGTIAIVATDPMDGLARVNFDLEGTLAGGGHARYSVQVDTSTEPGTIVWFSGPGVEWPDRRRSGPGLSTSAPPTLDRGRIR